MNQRLPVVARTRSRQSSGASPSRKHCPYVFSHQFVTGADMLSCFVLESSLMFPNNFRSNRSVDQQLPGQGWFFLRQGKCMVLLQE